MGELKAFSAGDKEPDPQPLAKSAATQKRKAKMVGWKSEEGKGVFYDGTGNVRGEVIFPDDTTHFFRVNYTDGIQNQPALTWEAAKERIERYVAGM